MRQRLTNPLSTALLSFSLLVLATLSLAPSRAFAWDWSWGGKSVTGSGVIKTETRNVTGFTGISLALPAIVTIRQGNKEGITIEADDNLLPLIETVVESGSLKIRTFERKINFRGKNNKLNIIVDAINVEQLSVAGSGDIKSDQLNSPKLKASIDGSGDVNINNLISETVKVSISGSGDFAAGGSANEFEVSIAGSGGVKAERLKAKNAKISVAGSGDAALWATESIKVSIAGSGDIRYYGDAQVSKSVAGSGSVTRLGTVPN